jgi:hypothetical protein
MRKNVFILCMFLLFFSFSCKEKIDALPVIESAMAKVTIPVEIDKDITLPTKEGEVSISWTSSNPNVLSSEGKCCPMGKALTVTLSASFTYLEETKNCDYQVEVNGRFNQVMNQLVIPTETKNNIDLPTKMNEVSITWSTSSSKVINKAGEVFPQENDCSVLLSAYLSYQEESDSCSFFVNVPALSPEELLDRAWNELDLVDSVELGESIPLPQIFKNSIQGTWTSKQADFDNQGNCLQIPYLNEPAQFELSLSYHQVVKTYTYYVNVPGLTDEERIQSACSKINMPTTLSHSLILQTNFEYGVTGIWTTDQPNILSSNGVLINPSEDTIVKMILELSSREEKMNQTYTITASHKKTLDKPHQLIYRASDADFNESSLVNLQYKNSKVVLSDSEVEGSYESEQIDTISYVSLIGSWACITSVHATIELMVRTCVDGEWSSYVSYRPWGLGRENSSVDTSGGNCRISTDEVLINNSKSANKLQYKVILRRDSLEVDSPQLSLVSFALESKNYQYENNLFGRNNEVFVDLPRLYQQIVPSIGGVICSATTSTMLLKGKGFDFSSKDEYEHRYIAGLVKDYGKGIYGNWVYNTATIGAYGLDSYVGRMYSISELLYQLDTMGACGLSVKGTMISNKKTYTTAGHLIVAVGYKYVNNQLIILVNDPNVSDVLCEYSEKVIQNTWRGVCYLVE